MHDKDIMQMIWSITSLLQHAHEHHDSYVLQVLVEGDLTMGVKAYFYFLAQYIK